MDGVLDKNRIVEPLEATKDDLLVVALHFLGVLRTSFVFFPLLDCFHNTVACSFVHFSFFKALYFLGSEAVLDCSSTAEVFWLLLNQCTVVKASGKIES